MGSTNTIIGSITQNGRNTICDNGNDAIWCGFNESVFFPLSGACYIVGNNVGTDVTGNVAIPNDERSGCVGLCIVTDTVWITLYGSDFAVVGSPGGTRLAAPAQGSAIWFREI